jgi:hypothetical protein
MAGTSRCQYDVCPVQRLRNADFHPSWGYALLSLLRYTPVTLEPHIDRKAGSHRQALQAPVRHSGALCVPKMAGMALCPSQRENASRPPSNKVLLQSGKIVVYCNCVSFSSFGTRGGGLGIA